MRESEITDKVEAWLIKKGFSTRREVRMIYREADLVAFKPPNKFIAIEVKGEVSDPIRGVGQAIAYGLCTDESYIAIDKRKLHELYPLINNLSIGIMVVDEKNILVIKKSGKFNPKKEWKKFLSELFLKGKGTRPRIDTVEAGTPEMRRLVKSITIESLWFWILKLLEKSPCHAYILRKKIEDEFGFLPGNVTGYKVLYFLKRGKYVDYKIDGMRKTYHITEKGRKELEKARKYLNSMMNTID
jgi:DNA-binding PadR family transcriptional regulator